MPTIHAFDSNYATFCRHIRPGCVIDKSMVEKNALHNYVIQDN